MTEPLAWTPPRDDEIRHLWREAGGDFYGHVEHADMLVEKEFLPFMRALISREREAGRREGIEKATQRWQAEIHKLCPEHLCRDGMLYFSDGKAAGSCGWRGHVIGGHT